MRRQSKEPSSSRGLLTLACNRTGQEIRTDVVYSKTDLDRAKNAKLKIFCEYCKKVHLFYFKDAVLRPRLRSRRAASRGRK